MLSSQLEKSPSIDGLPLLCAIAALKASAVSMSAANLWIGTPQLNVNTPQQRISQNPAVVTRCTVGMPYSLFLLSYVSRLL